MSTQYLRYCPELNQITGGVNATILLLQLEYWFSKTNGNAFYKFLESCTHENYKKGDSWTEELGFSKNEFRNAFDKIGKVYKSKKAFRESQDIFEGKYYASYYDRKKGLTYYVRNHDLLNSHPLFNDEMSTSSKSESPLSVDYNKRLPEVNNTHIQSESVPYDTIKALFNSCCPSFPQLTLLTPKRKAMLKKLWLSVGRTLENFKRVFLLAEQSDFLSGRKGPWRASFDWLIQEDKFVALLEGTYTNPHFTKASSSRTSSCEKFTNTYSHNWNFEEFERLEQQYIDKKLASLSY